jgi:tetratricopeptide (TPR) repeat protein
MSTWLNHADHRSQPYRLGFARSIGSTLALAACASLSVSLLTFSRASAQEEPASNAESSLLVVTHDQGISESSDAPTTEPVPSDPSSGEAAATEEPLEPVSNSSDPTPDLADEESTVSDEDAKANVDSQFADALAKVAQQPQSSSATTPSAQPSARRSARNAPVAIEHEPVKFQGVSVGRTTKDELLAAWGEAVDTLEAEEGDILIYNIEPFASVEVLIDTSDVASTIKVTLATALEPGKLAEQLALHQFEPVSVLDDDGHLLGLAFPERGVLFMYEGADEDALPVQKVRPPVVSQVAIQPLDSRAFALRAEKHLRGPFEQPISDLLAAIALDPDDAQAHWLLAQIYLTTGQADSAHAEASAACNLEPNNAAYQLCQGQALALLGEYDEAVHTVRAVLDRPDIKPIVRAQALFEMARLASLGDVQIASKAIPFHTRAIEIADGEATSQDVNVRRAAKQLLIEAHLAVAEEIARQAFNQKVESLSQWIGRASGLAEEFIANDGGSVELRLVIAQRALAALASFKPTLDPSPWVEEAEESAELLLSKSDEQLWQQRVQWELGIAYLHALRVEHSRRQTANALRYGQLAVENLAEGALSRQAVHSSEYLVAQLYFHMGAVYAVHQEDHLKAIQWYDKAAPILTGPRPVSELYAPRREGEMLVSIGVTCWQLGQQARALELTRAGVNLVELAVEDGILARSALAVPYGNLATMYEQMGETTNAAKYSELVKSVTTPAAGQSPRPASAAAARPNRNTASQASGVRPRPMVSRR